MADTDIPQFRTYAEGEPIPRVDPRDFPPFWKLKPPWVREMMTDQRVAPEQNTAAVYRTLAPANQVDYLQSFDPVEAS